MFNKCLLLAALVVFTACGNDSKKTDNKEQTMNENPTPGTGGNKYLPYDERTGDEAVVYFTRDLSAEGLIKAY